MSNDEKDPKEGARSFAFMLHHINDGGFHSELSETLQKVIAQLRDHAEAHTVGKGSMTIKLNFTVEKDGIVSVDTDVATKLPKEKRGRSVFWTTEGNNLTAENPRQQRLPIRDVSAPVTREVPNPERSVRNV